jgi:hypothetical protein
MFKDWTLWDVVQLIALTWLCLSLFAIIGSGMHYERGKFVTSGTGYVSDSATPSYFPDDQQGGSDGRPH